MGQRELGEGFYISRLTVPIRSSQRPDHVHAAGTEIAPVEKLGSGTWLVEIRVQDEDLEDDAWYETVEVRLEETEVVLVREEK